jgi:hypothetical protein
LSLLNDGFRRKYKSLSMKTFAPSQRLVSFVLNHHTSLHELDFLVGRSGYFTNLLMGRYARLYQIHSILLPPPLDSDLIVQFDKVALPLPSRIAAELASQVVPACSFDLIPDWASWLRHM